MPKRYKNLYEKICTLPNLVHAFYKARKGKRKKGNVAKFEVNLEQELILLKAELLNNTYEPGSYKTFEIFEPKKRMISAAPFRDRVVHHALCNVIEPIFEKSFIYHCYANRKGKGTHAAIRHCQTLMRKYPWVLKCDIKKYFPSIDHAVLKTLIAKKIACPNTLQLIYTIIDHSNPQEPIYDLFPRDDLFSQAQRRRGLPMGNLTSQFLANLYLSPFDHFVEEKTTAKGYIRYVDDFVIFGQSKAELISIKEQVRHFLEASRLILHPLKCHISPTAKGITFLGQRIFITHRLLKSENVRRFWKRITKQALSSHNRFTYDALERSLNSWKGHASQADTFRLQKKVRFGIRGLGKELVVARTGSWVVL